MTGIIMKHYKRLLILNNFNIVKKFVIEISM